ncbi:MAG: PrgI family protein [Lachnospiraceae bacterium]|nr:PrgI family protein [Lachnospiraceae bacterium]
MLEVKANKELKNIKSEIFMGLGSREIIILVICGAIVGFIFYRVKLPILILSYITAPLIALATFLIASRPFGYPPEKFLFIMIKSQFINGKPFKFEKKTYKGVIEDVAKNHRKTRSN